MRYSLNNNIGPLVKCPYFLSFVPKGINCESFVSGSSKSTLYFDSVEDAEAMAHRFCTKYPNRCPIAVANDKKYGENHE